jgi:threonine dehydrogenase-like Zn-dependent dehydrogenase
MFCPYLKGTGTDAQGGHAEYMLMNADATHLIPDKVSYEQAAPIFCAGYTVYSGLRWADPQPHERVAVLGIGGLGHLAVQYAKAAGFETIAVSHSPDKDKMIRDLGADEVVRDGKSLAAAGGADAAAIHGCAICARRRGGRELPRRDPRGRGLVSSTGTILRDRHPQQRDERRRHRRRGPRASSSATAAPAPAGSLPAALPG